MTRPPTIDFLLVTVGTTGFDALVAAADGLADRFDIRAGLVQYGPGTVEPRRLPSERFVPSLEPYYDKATVVVAHGGAGTAFEVLNRRLRLVGVANDDRYDDHQEDLLGALAEARHAVWCRDLARLADAVDEALTAELVPIPQVACTIGAAVDRHLDGLASRRRARWPWSRR